MKNDNTIKPFTANDIEKYHRGLLSPKEMHDLEKAALDDPFLADALEGYAVPGVNAAADIAELKKRVAEKTDRDKIVVVPIKKESSFPWMRIAAMIVLIVGAGLLIYQFGFNNKSTPIANVEKKDEQVKAPDTAVENDSLVVVQENKQPETSTTSLYKTDDATAKMSTTNGNLKEEAKDITAFSDSSREGLVAIAKPKQQVAPAAPSIITKESETSEKQLADDKKKAEQVFAKEELARRKNDLYFKTKKDSVTYQYDMAANETVAPIRGNVHQKMTNQSNDNSGVLNQSRSNVFRGQVTDVENHAVPFANITNTADNIGTYTDIKGNFTLISPDTVLNVQVRSLGYDNNNIQLRNQAPVNKVIMQEDRNSLSEIVVSNKKVNSTRSRTSTLVLDEPEPVDGWVNYDTYIINNLNVPETFKTRQASGGEVTLSFEVNNKGEPVNITVDKSLCESCDKEAIRLVKEGPKWKRKSRKGRTSVTISF